MSRVAACVELIRLAAAKTIGKEDPPQDDVLPIAIDLFATAFSMKAGYQTASLLIARRYCDLVGLDAEEVRSFAIRTITELEVGHEDGKLA